MPLKSLLPVTVAVLGLASPSIALAEPWTFTNGDGQVVTLDEVPARIIASQDAAAALIPLGIRPVGIYAWSAPSEAKTLEGLDLTGIEIIGQTYGEVNIEAAAALEPDLIVDEYWPVSSEWGGGNDLLGPQSLLAQVAPVVGVTMSDSVAGVIGDYEAFVASLGVTPDPIAIADKATFEASRDAFIAAVKAKPDLTVLAVAARPDGLYVSTYVGSAELTDFRNWGLDIIVPETINARGYFELLSWETADKYQADLIIIDNRSPANLETALAQPSWTTLKAAAAGAIGEWPAWWLRNYRHYAAELDKLTAAINAADENLVD